jgi:hypothetical protein
MYQKQPAGSGSSKQQQTARPTLLRSEQHMQARGRLKFTAHLHEGGTASELSWQSHSGFGKQRIMWAIGTMGGSGDCSAPLDYHARARGMASLNFPGFASPC